MKTKCYVLLAVVLLLLGSLSFGCQSRYYSEEEVVTLIWARLPNYLTEHDRSQFDPESREVTYLGKWKWLFQVSGSGEDSQSWEIWIPSEWGERLPSELGGRRITSTRVIRTYDLKLTAHFYEKTGVIEILDIEKFNVISK